MLVDCGDQLTAALQRLEISGPVTERTRGGGGGSKRSRMVVEEEEEEEEEEEDGGGAGGNLLLTEPLHLTSSMNRLRFRSHY